MSVPQTLSSGVPGLDAVLGGALRPGTLTLIVGPPGAGKTVLASQLIFHEAQQGQRMLVLTAFSEGLEQYLEHLQSFTFFDASLIGNAIQIFTLRSLLEDNDEPPVAALVRTMRETGVQMVLLDGFQGIKSLLPEGQSVRRLLSSLATQMRYLNITLLLTYTGAARDTHLVTELTTADVAIGLGYSVEGRKHVRHLDVVKQRGRAHHPGLHTYRITSNGVQVFPRLETYVTTPTTSVAVGRAAFGLPELDRLLAGGLNVGTITLLAGASGTGKTTLGLHWALHDARADAATVFLTFSEYPAQLTQKAGDFGLNATGAMAAGALRIVRVSPVYLDPDEMAQQLLDALADGQVRRVVIDDAAVLTAELGPRVRDYIGALASILYRQQISALLLYEIPPVGGLGLGGAATPFAALCDNTLVMQQYKIAGDQRRLLAVLRMRFSVYDRTLREVVLENGSVRVLAPQQSGNELLTIGAELSGGVAPTEDS